MVRIVEGDLHPPYQTRVVIYDKVGVNRGTTVSHPLNMLHAVAPTKEAFTKHEMYSMIMPMRTYACQSNVSEKYITEAISRAQIICILYNEQTINETKPSRTGANTSIEVRYIKPLGFILAYPADKSNLLKEIYIDIICASAQGSQFLQHFTSYAQMKEYQSIGLSSLPSVLGYYPKFGYEFRKDCDSPSIPPSNEISQYIAQAKQTGAPIPKTSIDAYQIPTYLDFMVQLHNQGFSVKTAGECGTIPINPETLREKDCGEDGYTMKLCNIQSKPVVHGGKTRRGKRNSHNKKLKRTRSKL